MNDTFNLELRRLVKKAYTTDNRMPVCEIKPLLQYKTDMSHKMEVFKKAAMDSMVIAINEITQEIYSDMAKKITEYLAKD